MKRKALALTLGLLLTLATFTGCGTQTKKASVGTETTKSKAVTITYAIWDSNQEKGLRTMADEFEKENSNIKIKIQVTGWADYWTALEAGATGGSLPDTFWMHSNEIYKYASNDQLLNLNDRIKASKKIEMDKFPSGLKSIYNYKSNQYAIPKDYDTIGLWYNKTMFDKEIGRAHV